LLLFGLFGLGLFVQVDEPADDLPPGSGGEVQARRPLNLSLKIEAHLPPGRMLAPRVRSIRL
jgi:hypothetical protein